MTAAPHHALPLPVTTPGPPAPTEPTTVVPDYLPHSADPAMDAAMRRIQDLFHAGQQHLPAVHTTPVPGAVEAIEPGTGARIWVYLPDQPTPLPTPEPVHQGDPTATPGWAKATALLTMSGALSIGAVIAVLGTYATSLAALAPLVWALGAVILGLAVLLGVLLIRRRTTAATAAASGPARRTADVETTSTSTATTTSRGVVLGRTTSTSTTTTTTRIPGAAAS